MPYTVRCHDPGGLKMYPSADDPYNSFVPDVENAKTWNSPGGALDYAYKITDSPWVKDPLLVEVESEKDLKGVDGWV